MTHYTPIFDTTEQVRASLAYQTTALVTLSWILVTAATARADIIDRRRLCAERQLLKANQKLEDLAARDPLTGLANRRRFEELLQTEHRRAKRSRSSLSLVAVDVDQFKSYNDIYGHPAGDACLKALAKAVDGVIRRPGDLAARIGGEEFSVLLPATNAVGASFMAAIIRDAVLDLAIPHRESPVGIVTISIGVATAMPTGDSSHTTLVAAADDALYEAKRNGRNVIQTASAAGIPSAAVTPSPMQKTPYTSPG
jgi:diguanylate cyclase (GGDEF)-like protein